MLACLLVDVYWHNMGKLHDPSKRDTIFLSATCGHSKLVKLCASLCIIFAK